MTPSIRQVDRAIAAPFSAERFNSNKTHCVRVRKTHDAPIKAGRAMSAITRIELRLVTGNRPDAGTDGGAFLGKR